MTPVIRHQRTVPGIDVAKCGARDGALFAVMRKWITCPVCIAATAAAVARGGSQFGDVHRGYRKERTENIRREDSGGGS